MTTPKPRELKPHVGDADENAPPVSVELLDEPSEGKDIGEDIPLKMVRGDEVAE